MLAPIIKSSKINLILSGVLRGEKKDLQKIMVQGAELTPRNATTQIIYEYSPLRIYIDVKSLGEIK